MDEKLVERLEKEIEFQQEQFRLLYDEHFRKERYEDLYYEEMIEEVNKSKGRVEILLEK